MTDPRTDRDSVLQLRLQILLNGYVPIPNRDKRTFFKGWPSVHVDEAEITSWARRCRRDKATGIRIEDGLCVIDLDIDHPIIDRIVDRIFAEIPELGDETKPLLVRRGKGRKEAWFVRTSELFSRIHGRRWVAPGTSADAGTHSVEIFGGASPRQFGSFGPHTVDDEGAVLVSYVWADASPADTLKSELPVLDKSAGFRIVDIVETELRAAGFEPVERSAAGESDAVRVYDLVDTMQFELHDGRSLSLSELREVAQEQEGLRCSASWLEGPTAVNRTRCIIGTTKSGHLTIWESAAGTTHMEKTAEPRTAGYHEELNRLAEKLREVQDRKLNRIEPRDGAMVTASKIRELYAFCPRQQKGVVPIWASSMDDGMVLSAFRTSMLKHCDEEIGPRGGRVVINPVDIWLGDKACRIVQGLRMRPDRERPTYSDEDGEWINVYSPPDHSATRGSPDVGIAFLTHLIPDPMERQWFIQWLAHKLRWPHIPGPAVIMVARQFGTGRGTLAILVGKLFGQRYVKTVPFAMVAGASYQSQYTDWGAQTLVAVVNESSDSSGKTVFASKRNTYEHLKELVEPRPTEKQFVSKSAHFSALSCTSYLIFTNHIDALPIPEDDRRFAVLSNGAKGEPEFWVRVNAWLEDDANVAAFAEWLRAADLTGYTPFVAPMMTKAKADMVEEAKSDLDRGLEIALKNMQGEVFTPGQVVAGMQKAAAAFELEYPEGTTWRSIAKREMRNWTHRVGVRDGLNWHPMIEGKRYSVYSRTADEALKWTDAAPEALRDEVLKNGPASGMGDIGNVIRASFKR